MTTAAGTASCSNSKSFGPTSTLKRVTPVMFAAGVVEAGDQPNLHRIGNGAKNNRDGRCCRLCCFCRGRGESTDYGRSTTDQFGRQRRKPVVLVLGPARLNRHVAAFAVAGLAKALTKGGEHLRPKPAGRSGREHANYRCSALLGPCCRRPTSRKCN